MKIKSKKEIDAVHFDTLAAGDPFKWGDNLYVKCETYNLVNAVRMSDGMYNRFQSDNLVHPVEGYFQEE